METLILKSFGAGTDGIVEFIPSKSRIKVKYSIRVSEHGIYKLLALSSLKPNSEPVIVHTLELSGLSASGERDIPAWELANRGYAPYDADTFVLVRKNKEHYYPVAAAFTRLAWDFGNNAFFTVMVHKDRSLLQAQAALESIKQPACPERYAQILSELDRLKGVLEPSTQRPTEELEWYNLPTGEVPLCESAYRHAAADVKDGVPMLFGIGELGLTALAVKAKENSPFENARDCVTEKNGFYIVGILFCEEGQYFARLY